MKKTNALILLVGLLAICNTGAEAFIGVNWGRQSAQRLLPSQVVDLLLQNGVGNARIFSSQEDILQAFAGSGINLTLTVFDLRYAAYGNASNWFKAKGGLITGANTNTVIIGGVPYVFDVNPNLTRVDDALNVIQSSQKAFDDSGNGHIKANTVHQSSQLTVRRRPSECEFIPEIKDKIIQFIDFIRSSNAPYLVDLFPILDVKRCNCNLSLSFALPPTNTSSDIVIKDINGAVYDNAFVWQFDCFAWALKKLNASDIKIVVSKIGWPTDGCGGANAENAELFFKYLLPFVNSNKGTPMRPGKPIDVYVQSLTDEPKMLDNEPISRHWGVYRSNGEPKYKIDLSGQGRDIYPTKVKGIMKMPDRYCLFNGNMKDVVKVMNQMERACKQGDCTTLAPGGSCSQLSFFNNVSYAFNVYFQTHFQDEKACDFEGLGYVSEDNPSTEECLFPVEVVKGQQLLDAKYVPGGGSAAGVAPAAGAGFRYGTSNPVILVLLFLVSIYV